MVSMYFIRLSQNKYKFRKKFKILRELLSFVFYEISTTKKNYFPSKYRTTNYIFLMFSIYSI